MSGKLASWFAALLAAASMACVAAEDIPNIAHMKAIAKREAARGDKGAQAYLDAFDGKGGAKARDEAGNWLAAAARRGVPEAQFQIALAYELEAVKQPPRAAELLGKAAEVHRKAAEQGYAPAQLQLAALYAKGQGVALDNRKAMEWATKAANGGDVDAQGWIGAKYLEGKIVPKDIARAIAWLEKAANQGHVIAQMLLAATYQNGKEMPADPVKARYWLERVGTKPAEGLKRLEK